MTTHWHTAIGWTYQYYFALTSRTWRNHTLGPGWRRWRSSSESISLPWCRWWWRKLRTVYISVGRGDTWWIWWIFQIFDFWFSCFCACTFALSFIFQSFPFVSLPLLWLSMLWKRFYWQWSILSLSSFKILAIFVSNNQYLAVVIFSLYCYILQDQKFVTQTIWYFIVYKKNSYNCDFEVQEEKMSPTFSYFMQPFPFTLMYIPDEPMSSSSSSDSSSSSLSSSS